MTGAPVLLYKNKGPNCIHHLTCTRPPRAHNTLIHSCKHIPHNVFYWSDLLPFTFFSLTLSNNVSVSLSTPKASIPLHRTCYQKLGYFSHVSLYLHNFPSINKFQNILHSPLPENSANREKFEDSSKWNQSIPDEIYMHYPGKLL